MIMRNITILTDYQRNIAESVKYLAGGDWFL